MVAALKERREINSGMFHSFGAGKGQTSRLGPRTQWPIMTTSAAGIPGAWSNRRPSLRSNFPKGHGHGMDGPADRAGQAPGRWRTHQGRDGLEASHRPLRGRASVLGPDGPREHRPRARSWLDQRRPALFRVGLVEGVPITRYCDEHHLTPRQRSPWLSVSRSRTPARPAPLQWSRRPAPSCSSRTRRSCGDPRR